MRFALTLLLFVLAVAAQAQAKLRVYVNERLAGNATVTQKLLKDGSKLVQLSMELIEGNEKVSIRSENVYDKSGLPTRKFQEMVMEEQRYRRQLVATFNQDGAQIVEDLNGKRTTKQVPLEAGKVRAMQSEFWFIRDKPRMADQVKSYMLNLEEKKWEPVITTYKGLKEITVDGQKVKAHMTVSEQGTAYLDDEGLPLRIEMKGARMERILKS